MLKSIRQSLITRLMAYFLFAGLLFVVLFAINFAHGLKVHFKQEVLPNIAQYLNYIAQDIGTPPDLNRAEQLTGSLSFKLSISGPGVEWRSNNSIPASSELDLEPAPEPYAHFQLAQHKRNNYVVLQSGDYQYMYVIGRLLKGDREKRNFTFIIIIMLSLLILFWLIRRSLKPLTEIGQGIARIGQGDMEHPIEPRGSSEFKNLSLGINNMASQIDSMLSSKRQLLIAISHELRSPLTRAKVNVELLPQHASKEAISHDLNEIQSLVSLIMESERLNQPHAILNKSEFELEALIHDVLQQYFSHAEFETRLHPVWFYADKTRIALLVKNLLDNALKYSAKDAPAPVIRVQQHQQSIIIEIEDYGCGMEHEELAHITEAFYRIDEARQRSTGGFGLGLYLCRLIVEAHGGEIDLKSEPQKGTKVRIIFPLQTR